MRALASGPVAKGGSGAPLRLSRDAAALLGVTPAALIWMLLYAVPIAVFVVYGFFRAGVLDIEYVLTLETYRRVLTEPIYFAVIANTMITALLTSLLVCVIAFIFAYSATFHFRHRRETLLSLVMISLFSGYLIRIYAWRTILGSRGIINDALTTSGLIDEPLSFLLYSRFAVVIVLANILLPFAIIPLYSALGNIRTELIEAARDQGAGPLTAIRTVVLPLAHRGILTAFAFTFVLAAGDYVTPQLVGGVSGQMVGNVIADQFGASFDWPLASALGVVVTILAAITILVFGKVSRRVTR